MAEALVSDLLHQLDSISALMQDSISAREVIQEIRLVVGDDEEIGRLKRSLLAIKPMLEKAEKREAKEKAINLWLKKAKDACYEIDDVLDELNTAMIKLKIEEEELEAENIEVKVRFFIPSPSSTFSLRYKI